MAFVPVVMLQHTAINSGTAVTVLCSNVSISGKKNTIAKPNANVVGPVEVQTESYENFKYSLSGVHFTDSAGTLTWDHVRALYQAAYNGSNYITLIIRYGSNKVISGLSGETSIKTVLESPSLTLSTTDTRNAYLPIGNLNLIETA